MDDHVALLKDLTALGKDLQRRKRKKLQGLKREKSDG